MSLDGLLVWNYIFTRGLPISRASLGFDASNINLHPDESTNISNLESLFLQGLVGHGGDGLLDLASVEVVGMELVGLPDVGAGVEGDGGLALSGNGAGRFLDGGRGRSGGGKGREGNGGSNLHCDGG